MNTSHSNAPKDKSKDEPEGLGDLALDLLNDDAPTAQPAVPQPAPQTVETSLELADAPPVIAKLEAAVEGLQMPSETDEPFRVVYWPLEKSELSDSEVAFYAAERADAPVESQSVDAFFRNAATIENWMDDDEKAEAARFGDLIETLQGELQNPRVYLIGEGERTVAVVGQVEGGFGGVVTLVVET